MGFYTEAKSDTKFANSFRTLLKSILEKLLPALLGDPLQIQMMNVCQENLNFVIKRLPNFEPITATDQFGTRFLHMGLYTGLQDFMTFELNLGMHWAFLKYMTILKSVQ